MKNHAAQRLIADMQARSNSSGSLLTEALGASSQHLRQFNRERTLNCVRLQGPLPRVTIAQRIGLSRATVSNIIDELLAEGFVHEGDMLSAAPGGGRRPIQVHFNANAGCILGVDIGRTHLTFVAADLSGHILAHQSMPFITTQGPDICIQQLANRLRDFINANDISWDRIIGLSCGSPGTLDGNKRVFVSPPHMPGWNGVDIRGTLEEEFKLPVLLDNDANLGALGESRYGAGRTQKDFIYVKIGTGIGSGIIVNGQIYRGNGGFAGELGHITTGEDGPLCECGNRGCLESLAGADAIIHDACEGISLTRLQSELPDKQVSSIATKPLADMSDVIQAAREGDPACCAALAVAGHRIGMAVSVLINLFNPSAVILDGGVTHAGDILTAPLIASAAASSLPASWNHTRILMGELHEMAIALGAITAMIDEAFGQAKMFGDTIPQLPEVDIYKYTNAVPGDLVPPSG
jgi:predicted NBD/HSP70 family sugar kinase